MSAGQTMRIWQSEACPSWCVVPHGHLDAPVNRACSSDPIAPKTMPGVPLTLHPADGNTDPAAQLMTVYAFLEQGPREVGPRVVLSTYSDSVHMTLGEAAALHEHLGAVLATARAAMKGDDQ
ncbi:DUF6907 domain-containing protein [Actinomadura sp. WAC 06369]|uniref:DUF6907 domain-containing protein n=1 Tax=Actinomadura sp. WAC 06369 TaxID=2203193 RepID=UPI000F76BBD2|nr:hypothetical protein [Actinomadura sp. WAC 06369]RSN71358.1 hypothetical protein DMH08_02855 [Actinomadura sp. WAC 06369]